MKSQLHRTVLYKYGSSHKRFFIFLDVHQSSYGTCDIRNGGLPWAARDLEESLDHIGEEEEREKAHFLPSCHICFWLWLTVWVSLKLKPNGLSRNTRGPSENVFPNQSKYCTSLVWHSICQNSPQQESPQWVVTIESHCPVFSVCLIKSCAREVARVARW